MKIPNGQTEQGYLAAILDFHSAWYRDHLVQYVAKSEQLYFGLTGPSLHSKGKNLGKDDHTLFCFLVDIH